MSTIITELVDLVTFLAQPKVLMIQWFLVPAMVVLINVLQQLYWPGDKSLPPMVFHYFPWVGSTVSYGMDPYKFLFACREKYGDVFTFIMLGRRMTVALGPKGNNLSLGGKLSQVSAEEAYTHLTTPVFGKGVVYDCPNDILMQEKKFIKHGLSTEALQSYTPMIYREAEHFFEHELHLTPTSLGPKTIEILPNMSELITLTASRTLQGEEVRQALNKGFARNIEDLDRGFTPLNFLFPNLPLPSYRKRDKAQREMSNFYLDIMKKRAEGAHTGQFDMITALQGSVYRDGTPVTDRDVAHMMIAILMAGQHTSSATSSWTLLHLADRPDIVEQLYDEQKKVFGREDGTFGEVTNESIKQMPLLDSVIRETLRMHAPIHSIYRKVISPIPVPPSLSSPSGSDSPYVIPQGHFLVAAPGVSAMDPLIWSESKTWNPMRWLDEKGIAAFAKEQYSGSTSEQIDYGFGQMSKGTESPYQPFGAGRHRCVGESFAYLQISVIVSYIVRNFTMKLDTPAFPSTNYQTLIVLPAHGHMSFTRRKQFS